MSIPLTFDWLTLLWLRVRLQLLWRARRLSGFRHLALLALLGVASGCVPVTRFEEAQSAAQVDKEGWRRSELEVAQLKADKAQLEAQLELQRHALDEREQALSQAKFDTSTQDKQREDAEDLVEQLRSELARVGGHLHAFQDDKQKLKGQLESESARARGLARLSRDLSLSLADPLTTGEYALDPETEQVVLRVPRDAVLTAESALTPAAEPLLKAVAHVLALHPEAKLRVQDASAPADAVLVAPVVAALGERGVVAERFVTPAPETETETALAGSEPVAAAGTDAAAPSAPLAGAPELAFDFSLP